MADNAYTQAINTALTSAKSMLGKNEVPNHSEIQSYLRDGGQDLDPHKLAWCAAFVSASLQKAGLPIPTQVVKDSAFGPGAYAPNYRSYGSPVDPKSIQAGDIMVANNGTHVGFAEGPIRQGQNGPEVQLLAGNEKDASGQYAPGSYTNPATGAVANRAQVGQVGERWVPLSQYSARRYVPTDGQDASQPAAPAAPSGTTINSTPAAQPSGLNLGNLSAAIKDQESSGNYNAVNRRSGALGAYQVMPFNLPEWGKAAGYEGITPQQFLANPKAQDDIANAQLENYATKYGNVNDVATAWYGGEKAVGNPNVPGGKGYPTTGGYASQVIDKYNALGGTQASGPIDPSIIARGGTSPPIPGTTINSTPAVAGLGGQVEGFTKDLKKTLGMPDDDAKDQGQQEDIKPSPMIGPAPQARNVSALLGGPGGIGQGYVSPTYAQNMAALAKPMTWGSAPPGQMPGTGYGMQPQPSVFGTSLMSNLQRGLDPMWMNSWGQNG